MPKTIKIGVRDVGPGAKPFVIAEVAQAHDGSLGMAHAFVDLVADCGADAIKFQTHIASAESTLDEPFRIPFSYEDGCRYDYWRRMEFTAEQWAGLVTHAREKGLVFLSSAFSCEAVHLLSKLDMPAWKVASGELSNRQLLNAMIDTGKPLLLSSGMSSYAGLEDSIAHVMNRSGDHSIGIFQCTTKYPTPWKDVGLNVLAEFRSRFGIPVGLSDHSGDVLPSIAAMSLGANLIEVHIAFHERQFGPDTIASLVPAQLTELCRARDAVHIMLTHQVDKDAVANALGDTSRLFGRSLALLAPQTSGTILTEDMLTLKKPGWGISPLEAKNYEGRRLRFDVASNRLLRDADFE